MAVQPLIFQEEQSTEESEEGDSGGALDPSASLDSAIFSSNSSSHLVKWIVLIFTDIEWHHISPISIYIDLKLLKGRICWSGNTALCGE